MPASQPAIIARQARRRQEVKHGIPAKDLYDLLGVELVALAAVRLRGPSLAIRNIIFHHLPGFRARNSQVTNGYERSTASKTSHSISARPH
jgi:hypothetical protein